ncbi:GDP-mannose transporter GONST3 [Vitis vinifera]|uniref:GDP-mannose transporter GONST3 n=1 Tax=Vitis vinifera TaxID=29760 RepID=A0A438C7T2_VITVI|nr:GDP-mannose transporter GONST3 [Vitis vinifera]
MRFPYPGALTALQYFTSVAGVLIGGWLKLIDHGGLHGHTLWRFFPAAVLFYISIFTNSELLLHSNVDTFIVVRSAVPIFVAVGETLFLHQPWPSVKTWLSLATIFGGSVLYVLTDNQFSVMALKNLGLVLYNNLEALLLFPLELLVMGEWEKLRHEKGDFCNWVYSSWDSEQAVDGGD